MEQLLETEPEITGGPARSDRQGGIGRAVGLAQRQGVGRSEARSSRSGPWAKRRWLGRDHTNPRARLPPARARATSATVEIHAAAALTQTVVMLSPDQTHETVKHPGAAGADSIAARAQGLAISQAVGDRIATMTLVGHRMKEDVDA